MVKNSPILVVGTGRSGTSTVAKALMSLGVDMGFMFRKPDQFNPEGVYEDLFFKHLNEWYIRKDITRQQWKMGVESIMHTRNELWGFKHPNTCYLLQEYINLLKPKFVWARRDIAESAASCARCYNMPLHEASVLMHHRNNLCEKHLKGQDVLDVWCGKLDVKKLKEFVNA